MLSCTKNTYLKVKILTYKNRLFLKFGLINAFSMEVTDKKCKFKKQE